MRTLLPEDRKSVIRTLLPLARNLSGIAIEVGVFQGGILAIIASALPKKKVIGFDTFEGLPYEHWTQGEHHRPGEFSSSEKEVRWFLNARGLINAVTIKGVFPESQMFLLEDEANEICFAHIDVDYYQATKESLEWIWPRIVPHGFVVIDDYGTPDCPKVKQAVDEVAEREKIEVHQSATGQVWLQKER